MSGCPEQTLEVDRLRERITVLEADRSAMMPWFRPAAGDRLKDGGFGGPCVYRPVSDKLRWNTGLFS